MDKNNKTRQFRPDLQTGAYMSKTLQIRNLTIGQGSPKIIVPIVGVTREEIIGSAKDIKAASPDVVEWRADWFKDVLDFDKVSDVLSELRTIYGGTPILFTFRTAKEGGEMAIEAEHYAELNTMTAATGLIDLIDVEVFTGDEIVSDMIRAAHRFDVKVVASNHDFHGTPAKDDIVSRLKKMDALGADIPKIAVMPTCRADVITLLDATQEADAAIDKPLITISMSGTGLVSRLAGEAFGSALTFGAVGKTSAPGQMNAEDLRMILELIHKSS